MFIVIENMMVSDQYNNSNSSQYGGYDCSPFVVAYPSYNLPSDVWWQLWGEIQNVGCIAYTYQYEDITNSSAQPVV